RELRDLVPACDGRSSGGTGRGAHPELGRPAGNPREDNPVRGAHTPSALGRRGELRRESQPDCGRTVNPLLSSYLLPAPVAAASPSLTATAHPTRTSRANLHPTTP